MAQPGPAPAPALTELRSHNGVLTATLEARPQKISLGGASFDGLTYNGDYAGPVLVVRPGDVMRIKLVNHLDEPTNLHFHGYHGSPLSPGDNVHILVQPGQSYDYVLKIPVDQPPGLYWYHAHIHHRSEHQIMGGLSGMMQVVGLEDQFPELKGVQHAIFALKEYVFDQGDDPLIDRYFHDHLVTINGGLSTPLNLRPGETGLWGFSNQSADLAMRLTLKGHSFRVIARDGQALTHEMASDDLVIPPAGRVEALIDAGAPGDYPLAVTRLTGSGAQLTVQRVLGVLSVGGAPVQAVPALAKFPLAIDLRTKTINAQRTFTLSEKPEENHYFINGQLFDPARVDTRVPLGNIEEWTIRNDSDDYHAFHIHQLGFQVVEINGVAQPFDGYLDTVDVPERGEVKIRLAFTDPLIVGRFMYHCHVLEHEDKGMMGMIEVYDPKNPAPMGGMDMPGMDMGGR